MAVTPLKSILEDRKWREAIKLGNDYVRIEEVPDMVGTLLEHQKVCSAAIVQVIEQGWVKVSNVPRKLADMSADNTAIIKTNTCLISAPFGSGKTFCMLAAYAILRKIITLRPTLVTGPQSFNVYPGDTFNREANQMYMHDVTKRVIGTDSLLRCAMIVVGSSVMSQWQMTIKNVFPKWEVLMVGDIWGYKTLKTALEKGTAKIYDVILVKEGMVSSKELRLQTDKSLVSLVWLVHTLLRQHNKTVLINMFDDFDSIYTPQTAVLADSFGNVFASATNIKTGNARKVPEQQFTNVIELLDMQPAILGALSCPHITTTFNVCPTDAFVQASTNITVMHMFITEFVNPDGAVIEAIGAIGDENAAELVQALNAGAINSAAATLGMTNAGPADIFKRILGDKNTIYRLACDQVKICEQLAKEVLPRIRPFRVETHSEMEVQKFLGTIQGPPPKLPNLHNWSPKLIGAFREQYQTSLTTQTVSKKEIDRVIYSITVGDCAICRNPLRESTGVVIVKCCGAIICEQCVSSFKFTQRQHWQYKEKATVLCGKCVECSKFVFPTEGDLVFVNQDTLKLDDLVTARGDEEGVVIEPIVEEAIEEPKDIDLVERIAQITNPKLRAVISIINDIRVEAKPVHRSHSKVMVGTVDRPYSPEEPKKILIFASYSETLEKIASTLEEFGVTFSHLGGTYTEMAETIREFRDHGTVLLINSNQSCAGMNLEFCTDIVFFHSQKDPGIAEQVIGRGQRIGRWRNLRVWFLSWRGNEHRTYLSGMA